MWCGRVCVGVCVFEKMKTCFFRNMAPSPSRRAGRKELEFSINAALKLYLQCCLVEPFVHICILNSDSGINKLERNALEHMLLSFRD